MPLADGPFLSTIQSTVPLRIWFLSGYLLPQWYGYVLKNKSLGDLSLTVSAIWDEKGGNWGKGLLMVTPCLQRQWDVFWPVPLCYFSHTSKDLLFPNALKKSNAIWHLRALLFVVLLWWWLLEEFKTWKSFAFCSRLPEKCWLKDDRTHKIHAHRTHTEHWMTAWFPWTFCLVCMHHFYNAISRYSV